MGSEKISVVIIALNEEMLLNSLLQKISGRENVEIIVSDGGSTDRTYEISKKYAHKVVRSEKGRGRQLNCGARYATGDTILFLHADSTLPDNFTGKIMKSLERPGVVGGAFDFAIDSSRVGCRIISKVASLRSRFLKMPYGDQGIFVRRDVFTRMKGFSDIPLMEDLDFFKRLRKEGKTTVMKDKIMASARLWERRGLIRTTLRNWTFVTLYLMGYSPVKLYHRYYHH